MVHFCFIKHEMGFKRKCFFLFCFILWGNKAQQSETHSSAVLVVVVVVVVVVMMMAGVVMVGMATAARRVPPAGPILCVRLPQLYRLVALEGRRRDDVLRRVAGRAQHRVGVALQTLDDLLALQVPDVHHVVLRAGHDPLRGGEKKTILILFSYKFS